MQYNAIYHAIYTCNIMSHALLDEAGISVGTTFIKWVTEEKLELINRSAQERNLSFAFQEI